MVNIMMYASTYCPYCRAARDLLDDKGVQYTIMDVDSDYSIWEEMTERSHRHTVPQIFIDALHVGGFDDLSALDARGGLDPLLNKR